MDKKSLLKYIEGGCSEEEKLLVTEWLDSDPQNMKEYMALRKLHDISIWQLQEINTSENKRYKLRSKFGKKRILIEIAKVAALFVLVFVTYQLFFFSEEDNETPVAIQTLIVPQGQRAQLTLVDGTSIWLNAKSKLTFPNRFEGDTREVALDGEGYFEVTKNKENPFIVNTDKYNVKVLGTTFNLRAYSLTNDFETSLIEGAVEILPQKGFNGALLKPNERVFLKENRIVIAPITHPDYFLWKDGILSFDDEPFADLMKKLELIFDIKIEIKNDRILKYRCTGKFRTKDGVEHILNVLKLANEFTYNKNTELNIITIK